MNTSKPGWTNFFTALFTLCCLQSCYKEVVVESDVSQGLNFIVTPYQEYCIHNYAQNLVFDDTIPKLSLQDQIYELDKFEIRGEGSLNFYRKSFSVNMDDELTFTDLEGRGREFENIKLISLVFDYTYIESCIGMELFKRVNLWPTYNFYTELFLNNKTQGLYLLVEDPEDYFLYQKGASFIIRRHYDHAFKHYELNENLDPATISTYLGMYNSIYSLISLYNGQQLYDSLMQIIDLPEYFTKLAIDMLICNGDATDEIYLYTKHNGTYEIFSPYPWDLDDIFADTPHEINRAWACGTVFGQRVYYSVDDVVADVGEKLIFSIEDDLDYKIAKDEYLYQKYLECLENVVSILTPEVLENICSEVRNQIEPFYQFPEIIAQSRYDRDATNYNLFIENLYAKRHFLLDRRDYLMTAVEVQKKPNQ